MFHGSKFDDKRLRQDFQKERDEILAKNLEEQKKRQEEQRKLEEEQRKRQEEAELNKKKEEERNKFLNSLPEEKRLLVCLKERILQEGEVKPGTETAKMLNNIMVEAKSWSLENKKAFVDELGPLVKKYISKGKINKEIKKVLAEFREAK